jgi:hypothetical protein
VSAPKFPFLPFFSRSLNLFRWDALFPAIFGAPLSAESDVFGFAGGKSSSGKSSSSSSSSSPSGGQLYCVKRASWGLGPRPFYTDFVEQVQSSLFAFRTSEGQPEVLPRSLSSPLFF